MMIYGKLTTPESVMSVAIDSNGTPIITDTAQVVTPINGLTWQVDELQQLVEGIFDVVYPHSPIVGAMMVVNKRWSDPEFRPLNVMATRIMCNGVFTEDELFEKIYGNAVICSPDSFEDEYDNLAEV